MEHKKVALVLLGVIGVIAIGGLVLMYSQSMSTGLGVYSNPAKYNYAFPNWIDRGVPLNIPPTQYWDQAKQPTTDWNNYGVAKRYPGDAYRSDIPAVYTSGGRNTIKVPVQLVNYYMAKGWNCIDQTAQKAGYICTMPSEGMLPTRQTPMANMFLQ